MLLFDAGGLADLIDRRLLVAHELSVTLELFRETPRSVLSSLICLYIKVNTARRSEICGFTFDDLTEIPRRGPAIRLVKSETDQEGASKLIPINQGFVDLILRWRVHAKIEGVILRSVDRHGTIWPQLNPDSVRTILNRLIAKTSLPDKKTRFSGHSFRVGVAIDLAETGASMEKIMLRGGWHSNDSVMNYLRSR